MLDMNKLECDPTYNDDCPDTLRDPNAGSYDEAPDSTRISRADDLAWRQAEDNDIRELFQEYAYDHINDKEPF